MRNRTWQATLGSLVSPCWKADAVAAMLLGTAASALADPDSSVKSTKAQSSSEAKAAQADAAKPARILLRGGTVIDGSGKPGEKLDVLVEGERIAQVGQLGDVKADRTIDCTGLLIVPGFIDLHNHSDSSVLGKATRNGRNYLTQGCTTLVTGNCGGGQVDVARYLKQLDEQGVGVNVVHLIPAGAVRSRAMGNVNRPPSDDELKKMLDLVEQGMQAGAWGMSTGLIYVPGAYADTKEIVSLAKVVSKHGGIYASHIRGEGTTLIDAVTEAIQIGKEANLPVHVSHFKASGRAAWGNVRVAARLIEQAREAGQVVTADQYPYTASSTSLAAMLLPSELREGTNADLAKRFKDPNLQPKLRREIEKRLTERVAIQIASYRPKPEWSGQMITAIAEKEGRSPADIGEEILSNGGASAVSFAMNEEDVRFVMQLPWVVTASDGSLKVKDGSKPHPRSYGTFPRKLGRYVIREKVMPLEQAIRSCSGLPADILGMKDRGYIKEGLAADIAVINPDTLIDHATYQEPFLHSEGVEYVLVNGQLAIDAGKPTDVLAGKALRKPKQ